MRRQSRSRASRLPEIVGAREIVVDRRDEQVAVVGTEFERAGILRVERQAERVGKLWQLIYKRERVFGVVLVGFAVLRRARSEGRRSVRCRRATRGYLRAALGKYFGSRLSVFSGGPFGVSRCGICERSESEPRGWWCPFVAEGMGELELEECSAPFSNDVEAMTWAAI